MTDNGDIVITGPENIEGARWLAVRAALKLEIKGIRRGRGSTARQLANQITGQNHTRRVAAYEALNIKIAETLGAQFNRPLSTTHVPVEQIPLPWLHPFACVKDREFPADRPRVVDLVFVDDTRTAETRGSGFSLRGNGIWWPDN